MYEAQAVHPLHPPNLYSATPHVIFPSRCRSFCMVRMASSRITFVCINWAGSVTLGIVFLQFLTGSSPGCRLRQGFPPPNASRHRTQALAIVYLASSPISPIQKANAIKVCWLSILGFIAGWLSVTTRLRACLGRSTPFSTPPSFLSWRGVDVDLGISAIAFAKIEVPSVPLSRLSHCATNGVLHCFSKRRLICLVLKQQL